MTRYSVQIVQRVADKEDIHPTELDCKLSDVIDPEALDQLMRSLEENDSTPIGVLIFEFCGYTVRVSAAGDITVL